MDQIDYCSEYNLRINLIKLDANIKSKKNVIFCLQQLCPLYVNCRLYIRPTVHATTTVCKNPFQYIFHSILLDY